MRQWESDVYIALDGRRILFIKDDPTTLCDRPELRVVVHALMPTEVLSSSKDFRWIHYVWSARWISAKRCTDLYKRLMV